MSKIYGIKYIPTDKIIYIGQTIQSGKKRWYDHIRQALRKEKTDKLHTFMKQEGVENFEFIILFENECSKEELNKLEELYIQQFDTYKNGYNTYKKSGIINLNISGRKIMWYNNDRQYQRSFNSIVEASKYTNVNSVNISHCCNKIQTKTTNGWFRFEGDLTPLEDSYRLGTNLKVDKLDPFTFEVIKTYSSLQQAEQAEGITKGYLSAVCLGKRYGAKGFPYRYNDENLRQKYCRNNHIKTGVAQVNIETKIVIAKFLTCEDAAKITGLKQDTITRARHTHKPSVGYIWIDARDYLQLLNKGEIFEDEHTKTYY